MFFGNDCDDIESLTKAIIEIQISKMESQSQV